MPLWKRISWSQTFVWFIAIQYNLAWSHIPLGALTITKCYSTSCQHLWISSLQYTSMPQVAEPRISSHSWYLGIQCSEHFLKLRMRRGWEWTKGISLREKKVHTHMYILDFTIIHISLESDPGCGNNHQGTKRSS